MLLLRSGLGVALGRLWISFMHFTRGPQASIHLLVLNSWLYRLFGSRLHILLPMNVVLAALLLKFYRVKRVTFVRIFLILTSLKILLVLVFRRNIIPIYCCECLGLESARAR